MLNAIFNFKPYILSLILIESNGGAKVQVTGQVTGDRPQATGHRSHIKTIGHWTKLFWTDVLLYKNKISQGTLMIFLSFKQY